LGASSSRRANMLAIPAMVAARPLVVGSGKVNALYALVSWETVKASAHTVPARTGCCDVAGDATSVPHFTEKTVKRERRTEPGGCDSTGALNFRTTTVSKADANERFGSIREGVKCSAGANTHALSPNPKSDEGLLKSWIWDRLTRRDVVTIPIRESFAYPNSQRESPKLAYVESAVEPETSLFPNLNLGGGLILFAPSASRCPNRESFLVQEQAVLVQLARLKL